VKRAMGSFVGRRRRGASETGLDKARTTRRYPLHIPFLAAVVLTAAGCVPVPRGDNPLELRFMTTEDLRDYSEQVFREHNRVTTRLMMAPLDADAVSDEQRSRIDRAETRMNEACASLNRIASARARDQDTGIELENRVRRNVRACARRTERLRTLLDELEIGRTNGSASGSGNL